MTHLVASSSFIRGFARHSARGFVVIQLVHKLARTRGDGNPTFRYHLGMNAEILPTVELETNTPVRLSVIWLHGLGADGHDFEGIVPMLGLHDLGIRFVFPHAPQIPVTLNQGMVMRAWYDIIASDLGRQVDEAGIQRSADHLNALIARENERGMPDDRIVVAGFSQGGAIALYAGLRYPKTLAGILALSTYLVCPDAIETERSEANAATPIFQAHGRGDPMVPFAAGNATQKKLRTWDYPVEWHEYAMMHQVIPAEIEAVGAWLRARLGRRATSPWGCKTK